MIRRFSLRMLFLSAAVVLMPASAPAQQQPLAACNYSPNWSVFTAGATVIDHPAHSATMDVYDVLLPNVKQPVTRYSSIKLHAQDAMSVVACGCVQTGGVGKTWKRYVDPSGPNAGHLYRGMISFLDDSSTLPQSAWSTSNMTTVQNWMKSGAITISIPPGHTASLLLGYQDDGYGDNGYWGHDDGTGGQCHNVGGAAVQVTILRHH